MSRDSPEISVISHELGGGEVQGHMLLRHQIRRPAYLFHLVTFHKTELR